MNILLRFIGVLAISSMAGLFSPPVAALGVPAADITVIVNNDPLSLGNIGRILAVNNYLQTGGYSDTSPVGQTVGVQWNAPNGDIYLSIYQIVSINPISVTELFAPSPVSAWTYVGAGSIRTCGNGGNVTYDGYWRSYSVTINGQPSSSGNEFVVTGVNYQVGLCGNNI